MQDAVDRSAVTPISRASSAITSRDEKRSQRLSLVLAELQWRRAKELDQQRGAVGAGARTQRGRLARRRTLVGRSPVVRVGRGGCPVGELLELGTDVSLTG